MRKLFTFLLCLLPYSLLAQKENNIWIFGREIGLDFNSGTPAIVPSDILANEGCASICDASGKLMFYSEGLQVWDRSNTVMPNGSGLSGSPYKSSTMGVAITPIASDSNLFFLFILDAHEEKTARLRYSLIDMRLNSGYGDIVPGMKNLVVTDSGMSEKMLVAPTCGGVWLITHHTDSPVFFAYKITSPTIPRPVKSYTAGITAQYNYSIGEMKLSADYSRIAMSACTVWDIVPTIYPRIEVLDFDKNTGIVGTCYPLDTFNPVYSVEFSPDGSKLYAAQFGKKIYQYDLSLLPSATAVKASKDSITGTGYISIRRAPDGKLYTNRFGASNQISRISDPNKGAAACAVEIDIPSLTNTSIFYYQFGNNTFFPISSNNTFTARKDTSICQGDTAIFSGKPGRNYLWDDDDTSRIRGFSTEGIHRVISYPYDRCDLYIDTFHVIVVPRKPVLRSLDTVICFKDSVRISADIYSSYYWNDGTTRRDNLFTTSGTKWVTAPGDGCLQHTDTFHVTLTNFKVSIPDTTICYQDRITLDAGIGQEAWYLWQNGWRESTFTVTEPGQYWVEVGAGPCSKRDSILITDRLKTELGPDTVLCWGKDRLLAAPDIIGASYQWNTGSTDRVLDVKESGTYTVLVSSDGCLSKDSVMIHFEECHNCLRIPNAFTPNDDGINDDFKVINTCTVQQFSLLIYNRYGQIVFQTDDYLDAWDGKTKGMEQDLGVYYYLIRTKLDTKDAREELYKGDITLLR